MTEPAGRPRFSLAAAPAALLAVAAAVLAAVRPWGDVAVAADGGLVTGRPVGHVVAVGVVAVLAVLAAARRPLGRLGAGALAAVTVVGAAVVAVTVLAVTTAQVVPRDGGWWALVGAAAAGLAGLLAPAPLRGRVGVAVALVPVLALGAVAALEAPRWPQHVVDASYPARFSEAPGPLTVDRVGWQRRFGADAVSAVIGGRLLVARDADDDGHCRLQVQALDLGTGEAVWSSARDLRCAGPRLAVLDGNNTVVRVVLRGADPRDRTPTGPATVLYLGTEDGRPRAPAPALDAVQWWTEGYGLVAGGATVRGLDALTGATAWERTVPRCDDGTSATLQLPGAPAPGTAVARSSYDDLGAVPGGQFASAAGADTVLSLACGDRRSMWLVDATGGSGADRVVPLPVAATRDQPLTFLPWLDTVVAVVPTAPADGPLHPAALVGVDLASGSVRWTRSSESLTAVDLGPTGLVSASTVPAPDDAAAQPETVTLTARDGDVRSRRRADLVLASVALTQGRVEVTPLGVRAVAADGATTELLGRGDCPVDVTSGAAPLLAGPGGVAVRCGPGQDGGAAATGLVSRTA